MRILGIETSCDETAAAVIDDGIHVRSNVIATSREAFRQLAGVIPEEAARRQVECMIPVLHRALAQAHTTAKDIDAIAVTKGPGLLGSLLVGTTTARTLAALWKKPLIGIHHTFGHLSSIWLDASEEPQFPIITLSASGGHTDLWYRTAHTEGTLLGRTIDDAAGEAFDKGAALLGLPYPGGPHLAKLAEGGDPHTHEFPLPLQDDNTLNFSFSGLKTALKYFLRDHPSSDHKDVAASYEHTICRHLVDRILLALEHYSETKEIHLVGGVSANMHLRAMVEELLTQRTTTHDSRLTIRWPATIEFCTDNAAMIAAAGFFLWNERGSAAFTPFETHASLPLQLAL
jgi:N6-L-threonylcarbamoyladenine synthase